MSKIAVIGLKYDTNIGDAIIADSLIYLLNENKPDAEIISLDLKGRETVSISKTNSKQNCIKKFLNRLKNKSLFLKRLYFNIKSKKVVKKYFETQLADVDTIIFAGGGIIECEHYNCHLYINLITKIADKKGIKIIYNAVGFNGEYKNNSSYGLLKKCLNNKNVSYISVRENQNEMKKYTNREVDLVCDPACWSSEAFGIEKDKSSTIIGIGLIRPEIFNEFGYGITGQELDALYYNILKNLKSNGYTYSLFTNGVDDDYKFGIELLKNHPDLEDDIIYVPKKPSELLEILSQYRVVFCSRMHAAICSYSLGIPSISICWNEKLIHFYKNIGYKERCILFEEFNAERICDIIIKCYQNGSCENEKRNIFRNSIKESIEKYMDIKQIKKNNENSINVVGGVDYKAFVSLLFNMRRKV